MYIYEFPELRPGIRAGNMDWLRTATLFKTKLDALKSVERVVVDDPCNIYGSLLQRVQDVCGIPVVNRRDASEPFSPGNLILYNLQREEGYKQFHADFGLCLGEYGKVIIESTLPH